jgi:hypothetical protein
MQVRNQKNHSEVRKFVFVAKADFSSTKNAQRNSNKTVQDAAVGSKWRSGAMI